MKHLGILLLIFFFSFDLRAQDTKTVRSYSVQVTFNKTVHVLFPSAVKYVDLGSSDIIASKVPGAENVLRIKAAVEGFKGCTNFTVICEDGTFYSFDVTYAKEPIKLNVVISEEIYSPGFGEITTRQVELIQQTIYRENKNNIKYLGSRMFSVHMLVRSIHVHEGLFFIHIYIRNNSNIPLDIDMFRFKIVDKKLVKRTAIQEIYIDPLTAYNEQARVLAHSVTRIIYVLPKFTLADDKYFMIELNEKGGARNQVIRVENEDFNNAKTIEKLKLK